ncbi:MAG TPA: ATP-binding protein, partial [Bacteroidales bacterium]|nr:ATP-binding protein [Bacteroidales bacterium]
VFVVITRFHTIFTNRWFSLGSRLQLAMSSVLVASFLIIGVLMVYYIIRLNANKNLENLSDRAHSMLVELQHKIGTIDDISTESPSNLEQLLTKFSNVYFSDVNMYGVDGELIATSRPEIFEAGLVSKMMNANAYWNMRSKHLSYYNLEETIGSHSYSSAYMPFYNEQNKLLAYLNLPYFTRQEDLKSEISTFLIAFINIYVFLIIIGLILSLIVSKYIIRPLSLLTGNIGRIGFGRKNEKLEWSRNDEVGKLVDEYNRMVLELERSAEILARSERESAWREMARQVAHEIKNPLTPMKLSVQHLQRAWKDQAPDWEDRLKRFTETMTEQIESLALIASEFSDFATMPAKNDEIIDIEDVIGKILILYQDISIRFQFERSEVPIFIMADRKQMIRVFTNLINNAVYAIGGKTDGMITLSAIKENGSVLITVADNGSGISREQAEFIFQPNFTTKTSGMGLGLAIVKSIILGTGGEIQFYSEENKGTTFMIRFPLAENN